MRQKIKKIFRSSGWKRGGLLLVLVIFITSFFFLWYKPKASAQIFLTGGTSWTVPAGWNNNNNTIETIGAGGGGGGGSSASPGNGWGGGGGGGYSEIINATLTPGSTVGVAIGTAGTAGSAGGNDGGTGGDTYLCSALAGCTAITDSSVIVGAKGGAGGASAGNASGGLAASGVNGIADGGNGGAGAGGSGNGAGGGGGAGGAAGPNGGGNNGTAGAGGSGNNGGGSGGGGSGDGSSGGSAGAAVAANVNGNSGGNGAEYDGSHGSGGGGGGGGGGDRNVNGGTGGTSGSYGAGGGGGGGGGRSAVGAAGAAGKQGLIRITYSYTVQADYRWRSDDGNETTGTSLASQDTAATINNGTTVRLRIAIKNNGDTNYSYRLQYAAYNNGCGSWTTVPNSATTEHFNMASTANYTDQAASTNASSGPGVITDPSGYTFSAGKLVQSPSNSATVSLSDLQFTELEYAVQTNANTNLNSYCFRVTNAGASLDQYDNYPILNINYPPSTPTVYSVLDGSTNTIRLPIFQFRSTDLNSDYLKYVVEECPTNSFPCGGGGHTYDQTSSQTCWSQQDAQTATAFASSPTLNSSTMAYCQMPTADLLSPNTTYYWRAKAIDPGGSNTYSSYTSVASFTTGSLEVNVTGGASITGGTIIGN